MIDAISQPGTVFQLAAHSLQKAGGFCAHKIHGACQWVVYESLRVLLKNHHWIVNPNTYAAKIHIYAIKLLLPTHRMSACAHLLPTLPVPPLEDTVRKYLKSIKPFVSISDFRSIQTRSNYFMAQEGAMLQQKLAREASIKRNWLEETWMNYAYLENRFSTLLTAWYGTDTIYPIKNNYRSYEERAARILYLIFQFREMIRTETLLPLEGGVPVCMNQFRNIFGSNRVPGEKCDRLDIHSESKHIVVFIKGHCYKMDVEGPEGTHLEEGEILGTLKAIIADAKDRKEALPMTVLTLQDRPGWAADRLLLAEDSGNRKILETIDTALLTVRFSDKEPASGEEEAVGLFKDVKGLWMDKGMNFTVFKNGRIGGTQEHTMADATIIARQMDWVYANEEYPRDHIRSEPVMTLAPHRLDWNVPNAILASLPQKLAMAEGMVGSLDLKVAMFEGFGKNKIKGWQLSPDSFVQMALQLAYFKLRGKIPFTYESAATRMFFHGRTETIRSASTKSLKFCKVMMDEKRSRRSKRKALKIAVETHVAYKLDAVTGKGCDRHLLALKRLAGDESVAFLNSEDYKLPFALATSQTPTQYGGGGGFFPGSIDGFGVSYHLYEGKINFHVSGFKLTDGTSVDFVPYITEALSTMRALYE